nr:unnamed protein product [Callosobruchus analis]
MIYAIGVLYRPPKGNIIDCFECLDGILSQLISDCNGIIMIGDLNINMLSWDRCADYLKRFLDIYSLTQIVSEPTRITPTSQSLLDLIICSNPEMISDCRVLNLHSSFDHCVVSCSLTGAVNRSSQKVIQVRNWNNFDHDIFQEMLAKIDWNYIYHIEDVDDMVQFITLNLLNIFDSCCPLRIIRVSKNRSPWITHNIREMMKTRDRAYSKFKRTNDVAHWQFYKELKNYVNRAIEVEKKAYLDFSLRQKDSRGIWKRMRHLNILNSNSSDVPCDLFDKNDINSHFVQLPVITKSAEQVNLLNKYNSNTVNPKFCFSVINTCETIRYLFALKSNAAGPDGLTKQMLELAIYHIKDHITFVLNKILTTGKFPTSWKTAMVRPIPKTNSITSIDHLRPINILSSLSKLLEMAIKEQISFFVTINNILPEIQSGFRPSHSCTTALLSVVDDIYAALDQKFNIGLVLLDFSKAFNTVDPKILCRKLYYYGFNDVAIELIKSYLENRTQYVCLNGNCSEKLVVPVGVPQGSILGPLLFALYIADFPDVIEKCQMHVYADDTQVYMGFKSEFTAEASRTISTDLDNLYNIATAHNLKLNALKSKVLLLGSKQKKDQVSSDCVISMNNEVLPIVDQCKNLGVWMDSSMRFTKHVDEVCKGSYAILKQLFPYRKFLSSSTKLMLCESLIVSKISFGDSVYGPAITKKDAMRLQRIQNSCFRYSFGIRKFEHISHVIKANSRLNLAQLRNLHLLTLVHKTLKTKIPSYLSKKLKMFKDVNVLRTRNRDKLVIPKHNSVMYTYSFSYNASKLYNELPPEYLNFSVLNFKKKLKSFLLSK